MHYINHHLKIKKPISYSVTKHGLIGITKYFATLWAQKGIRINTLSPGAINSNQDQKFKKKQTVFKSYEKIKFFSIKAERSGIF